MAGVLVLVFGEVVVERDLEVALLQAIGPDASRRVSRATGRNPAPDEHRDCARILVRRVDLWSRCALAFGVVAMRRLGKVVPERAWVRHCDSALPRRAAPSP